MKTIHESEYPYLEGTELLVVNALRFIKPHHSHQLVDDAIAFARRVGAKRTLLIHMCHDVGLHEKVNLEMLPADIQLAYDGQEIIL
jgi:phosphoribosyl 1,2-cyclic phosphate phosphodiesterase